MPYWISRFLGRFLKRFRWSSYHSCLYSVVIGFAQPKKKQEETAYPGLSESNEINLPATTKLTNWNLITWSFNLYNKYYIYKFKT